MFILYLNNIFKRVWYKILYCLKHIQILVLMGGENIQSQGGGQTILHFRYYRLKIHIKNSICMVMPPNLLISSLPWGKLHYLRDGGGSGVKGGRQFWTSSEEGRQTLDFPWRGANFLFPVRWAKKLDFPQEREQIFLDITGAKNWTSCEGAKIFLDFPWRGLTFCTMFLS